MRSNTLVICLLVLLGSSLAKNHLRATPAATTEKETDIAVNLIKDRDVGVNGAGNLGVGIEKDHEKSSSVSKDISESCQSDSQEIDIRINFNVDLP